MSKKFEFLLFSTDEDYVRTALEAGIDSIVIDWEHIGKAARQHGMDTQINYDTVADLQRIRQQPTAHIICRINNVPNIIVQEAEQAVDNGADEILVPMVRRMAEIEPIIEKFAGQAQISLMVETLAAVDIADELAQLPLHRVYVGLHDLALDSQMANLFENVRNGIVEQLREKFAGHLFGFGGLTIPQSGYPIPSTLLMQEMTRLDCGFTFLRRSFLKDVPRTKLHEAVPAIRDGLAQSRQRTSPQIEVDRAQMLDIIKNWHVRDG